MKNIICTILFAAVMLLGGKASAYRMTRNEPLDHSVYSGHDPKLIVAGQIVETDIVPVTADMGPLAYVNFRFKVSTVILGQQTYQAQTFDIPATSFIWPTELLTLQEGERCALVLEKNWGHNPDGYHLCSVAPVSNVALRTAKDSEEAKRILEAELLLVLKNEMSANRQRHLILQVAPILQKADSEALVPFLKSDDAWLRRAALAGLTYATKETNYLTMAYQDIDQYIRSAAAASTTDESESHFRNAPYPLLFSHYFFLADGWSWEEIAASTAYLPLFRLIAQSEGVFEWVRWDHGVKPLCRIARREDAKFLYEYCRDKEGNTKKEIFRFYGNRQRIILAISRILNLGLANWVESDFLKKEQEQHRQISEALVKEGIINEGEVHSHPESARPGPTQ